MSDRTSDSEVARPVARCDTFLWRNEYPSIDAVVLGHSIESKADADTVTIAPRRQSLVIGLGLPAAFCLVFGASVYWLLTAGPLAREQGSLFEGLPVEGLPIPQLAVLSIGLVYVVHVTVLLWCYRKASFEPLVAVNLRTERVDIPRTGIEFELSNLVRVDLICGHVRTREGPSRTSCNTMTQIILVERLDDGSERRHLAGLMEKGGAFKSPRPRAQWVSAVRSFGEYSRASVRIVIKTLIQNMSDQRLYDSESGELVMLNSVIA